MIGELSRLFNPRMDSWVEHFYWKGAMLYGSTNISQATINALLINHPDRLKTRSWLVADGIRFEPFVSG
jgi:hypothetical protein